MRNRNLSIGLVSASLILAGCSSSPEIERRPLTPPGPYRVAICPLEHSDLETQNQTAALSLDVASLRDRIVEELERNQTATELIAVAPGDRDPLEIARANHADFILRPRLVRSDVSYDGVSGDWPLSGLLWFLTWFGGTWIDDNEYKAALQIEWELVSTDDGEPILSLPIPESDEPLALDFWERNEAFSGMSFLVFFVPPFLLGDDEELTSENLTRLAVAAHADRLTTFLKKDLESSLASQVASMSFESPTNGSVTPSSVPLQGIVRAEEPIQSLEISLNDRVVDRQEFDEGAIGDQWTGEGYNVSLDHPLQLRVGENTIRIRCRIQNRGETTRTLVVRSEA